MDTYDVGAQPAASALPTGRDQIFGAAAFLDIGDTADERALIRDRASRLFDYLRDQHAIRDLPMRDVAAYGDRRWWAADIPHHSALRVRPSDDHVWLQVSKVPIPVPPNPPARLDALLARSFGDPSMTPAFAGDVKTMLACDDTTAAQYEAELARWLQYEWQPWAEHARRANAARSLYQDLFDLYLRLQRQDAEYELVWGHGFLTWDANGQPVRYPLLLTPCTVAFNGDTGEIRVEADGTPNIDVDCLRGLVPGLIRIEELRRELAEYPPDPWHDDLTPLFERMMQTLDLPGMVVNGDDVALPGPTPVVTCTSLLFVRTRVPRFTGFFQSLRDRLLDGHSVPPAIASIVADEPSKLDAAVGEAHAGWNEVGTRHLMPLSSNAEQEEIATRLARHWGVVVQGPPGTGKTHTIANLTAHLLAHGKRVLVTSFKQQPLEVLRGWIPDEVRALCVALLGSSAQALGQLEASVQAIHDNAVTLDVDEADRRIGELDRELDTLRSDVDDARRRLHDVADRESRTYQLGEREVAIADLARWLATEETAVGQIPDQLGTDDVCPLTRGEVTRYFELCGQLDPVDRRDGVRHLPEWNDLPDGPTFRRTMESLQGLHARMAQAQGRLSTWEFVDHAGVEALRELQGELATTRDRLANISTPVFDTVREEAIRGEEWLSVWRIFTNACTSGVSEIHDRRKRLAAHKIELPVHGLPGKDLIEQIDMCRERVTDGKKIGRLGPKQLREFRDSLRVDGEVPRTLEEFDLILDEVQIRRRRYGLVNRWNHDFVRAGGEAIPEDDPFPEEKIAGGTSMIVDALTWELRDWPALSTKLSNLGVICPDRCMLDDLDSLRYAIDSAVARHEYREEMAELEKLAKKLRDGGAYPESSPLWADMTRALSDGDSAAWEGAYDETVRLDGLRMHLFEADELGRRLGSVAPVWSSRIAAERGDETACGSPANLERMWQWRQAETWLRTIVDADDLVALGRNLESAIAAAARVTNELVAAKAWRAIAESLTDQRRRSLAVWAQALRKLRTRDTDPRQQARNRAEAERAMREAFAAVPVWVMPIYRVVETFDPGMEPFDVVIVDESSQCDLFTLAALGIARKAVIVGDSMQISPQTIALDDTYVRRMIDTLLPDLPNANLLEPHSSLYDVAARSYPGSVMLREHFRCLPEIITFSNEIAYDGRILPLREGSTTVGWRPIVTRYVPDGYRLTGTSRNPLEAIEIVETIALMCADPAYDGKTMGVISLAGDEQAHAIEEQLIQRLGETEMTRRRLRCGDAYQFQGDERDVILVSLTVARNEGIQGEITDGGLRERPHTDLADLQRVNVAASRARDQLWVFHSVTADEFAPGDVRASLLRYCTDPSRVPEEAATGDDRCESELERGVLRELRSRGYAVSVQHRVGKFKVDLVVEGEARRLAIECITGSRRGEITTTDERRRQEVLERLGWTFHRVRGSEFFRNSETTLRPLWDRLVDLHIDTAQN